MTNALIVVAVGGGFMLFLGAALWIYDYAQATLAWLRAQETRRQRDDYYRSH